MSFHVSYSTSLVYKILRNPINCDRPREPLVTCKGLGPRGIRREGGCYGKALVHQSYWRREKEHLPYWEPNSLSPKYTHTHKLTAPLRTACFLEACYDPEKWLFGVTCRCQRQLPCAWKKTNTLATQLWLASQWYKKYLKKFWAISAFPP